VLDDASVAIRIKGTGPTGWSGYDSTVDLVTRVISGTLSKEKEKNIHSRTLDADELAALRDAFGALCLKAEVSPGGAFGGGGAHYEIRQRDGSIRLVGSQGSGTAGDSYYAVTNRVGYGLAEVYPAPDKKRVPPSNEAATRIFIEELMFGTPFGPRDLEWSRARLDPKGDLFKLEHLPSTSPGARFEITPKRPNVLRVRELARELDVESPVAYQVNGEHDIWELGDAKTHAPIGKWRLGEIEVRLTMPAGTRGSGYSGSTTSVDGATIDFIIIQTTS
jgi:hypothetical protein